MNGNDQPPSNDVQNPVHIDVILATRNRAAKLAAALARFHTVQIPPDTAVRILVVDNGSSDDTRERVEQFVADAPIACEYLVEARPGLSHARNAGVARSTAEIVAFIDDDCYVGTDWLVVMRAELAGAGAADLIGGSAYLFDERDLPITIMTAPQRKRLAADSLFDGMAGLNFALHCRILATVGNFDTCLGAGSPARAAEDIDFFYRTIVAGYRVEYVPQLRVWHDHGRRDTAQKQTLLDGYVVGRGGFYGKHLVRGDRAIVRLFYWELRALLSLSGDTDIPMSLHYVWLLLDGCATYVGCRIRRALRRGSPDRYE